MHTEQDTALATLAIETKTPAAEVERIYKAECAKLNAGARILTFIPALALRRARARLRNHRNASAR
jgi:hypothetical protein